MRKRIKKMLMQERLLAETTSAGMVAPAGIQGPIDIGLDRNMMPRRKRRRDRRGQS